MRRNTIEAILRAMPLSSKDETRLNLMSVCIQKCPESSEKFLIQSTNGCAMMKEYVLDDQLKFQGMVNDEQFLIANTKTNINELKFLLKNKEKEIFPEGLNNLEEIHREYPRTNMFNEWADSNSYQIGINLELLQQVVKTMGKFDKKDHKKNTVIFKFKKGAKGENQPIYIQNLSDRGTDNTRVIMPVRL